MQIQTKIALWRPPSVARLVPAHERSRLACHGYAPRGGGACGLDGGMGEGEMLAASTRSPSRARSRPPHAGEWRASGRRGVAGCQAGGGLVERSIENKYSSAQKPRAVFKAPLLRDVLQALKKKVSCGTSQLFVKGAAGMPEREREGERVMAAAQRGDGGGGRCPAIWLWSALPILAATFPTTTHQRKRRVKCIQTTPVLYVYVSLSWKPFWCLEPLAWTCLVSSPRRQLLGYQRKQILIISQSFLGKHSHRIRLELWSQKERKRSVHF